MRWSVSFFLSLLPLAGLAGKSYSRSRTTSCKVRTQSSQNSTSTGTYSLKDLYQGQSFLSDDWEYFSYDDPTHGSVNYQTKENAIRKNLTYVRADGRAVLAVDDFSEVPLGANRDSIRINSKKTYNRGLFIADFQAMPYGCSIWPAFWSTGPNWPNEGEIDIVEGVHNQLYNQYTLHSGPGCSLSKVANKSSSGTLIGSKCTSSAGADSGCGFRDLDPRSYGKNFNNGKGGVFVVQWDDEEIAMWRFFRDSIPADITAKKPEPNSDRSKWGNPVAKFSSISCDLKSHFYDQSLILDISLCGDYGNPTYPQSGCLGTCAEAVTKSTNFITAKWEINYIAVYDRT